MRAALDVLARRGSLTLDWLVRRHVSCGLVSAIPTDKLQAFIDDCRQELSAKS